MKFLGMFTWNVLIKEKKNGKKLSTMEMKIKKAPMQGQALVNQFISMSALNSLLIYREKMK